MVRCVLLAAVIACSPVLIWAAGEGEALSAQEPEEITALVLRVDSEVPGEPVEFECALAFRGEDESFRFVQDKTPFELRLETDALNAIINAVPEDATVVVTLTTVRGDEYKEVLSANAGTVILGENLLDTVSRFIRGI